MIQKKLYRALYLSIEQQLSTSSLGGFTDTREQLENYKSTGVRTPTSLPRNGCPPITTLRLTQC